MNRSERRAAARCKHRRTDLRYLSTNPVTKDGESTGETVTIGYRVCLDCGQENRTPVRMT